MHWFHEIGYCLVALFLGIFLGATAGKGMPSLKLSWTWTPLAVVFSLVLPASVGAPAWMEVLAVTCSFAAMIVYAFSEITGRRERKEDLYTPLDALKRRWGRLVVTVCVILPLAHLHGQRHSHNQVVDILIGVGALAVMWIYGERNTLRVFLLSKAMPAVARYDASLAKRLEDAALDLAKRLERK